MLESLTIINYTIMLCIEQAIYDFLYSNVIGNDEHASYKSRVIVSKTIFATCPFRGNATS